MPTTIERTVSTGTVVDAEQLMTELLAASATIGAFCTGVGVSPPDPPNDDTLWLIFDAAPSEPAVDAVLAAYVDGEGDYVWPSEIVATAGAWHNVRKFPVAPSTHVEIDIKAKVRIGTAADFSVGTLYFDNMARRRGNGPVQIVDSVGRVVPYGDVPQYSLRLQASGNDALLQIRVQRSATVVFEDVHLEIETKDVPP